MTASDAREYFISLLAWFLAGFPLLGFFHEIWGFLGPSWGSGVFVFFPNFFQIRNSKIGPNPPPRNRAENSINYPPPLEFTEPHRLPPPRRNRAENSINYPPSNSRNLIDYPPVEIGPKTPSTTPPPPSNSRNLIDYPPEIGPKTPSTTPPRIHGTSSTTPLEIGPNYVRIA